MMQSLPMQGRVSILFGIVILLVLLTRLPFMPPHLYSFDSANLAFALTDFDPLNDQPQPPGYPLFVAEARLLRPLLGTPERTFAWLGILISGLSVGMLYLLGKRMFSQGVGMTAAALLFVNPVFWFSGLTSPLRPHLALISVLVAYFCWRALRGEPLYFYAASMALGIGSGFRPELLLFLFPLWIWTAVQCGGQALRFFRAAILLGASTLVWVVILVIASGGLAHMIVSFSAYLFSQAQQTSVLLDPRASTWIHSVGRAILWNSLGVVPWIWTLPFFWLERRQLPERNLLLVFLAVWFVPPFAFHLAVHIGDPDQALSSIPVLCLLGGFCLVAAEQTIGQQWLPDLKDGKGVVIWIALVGNMLLFFGRVPIPPRAPSAQFRGWQSLTDAILVGTYESSFTQVAQVAERTDLTFKEIQRLQSSTDRPVLLLWSMYAEPIWRKVCFYFPSEKVYALYENVGLGASGTRAQLWSGPERLASYSGIPPFRIPVPKGGRLVWLLHPSAVEELRKVIPLQAAPPVYYTDLPADAPAFRWGSFEFVPE